MKISLKTLRRIIREELARENMCQKCAGVDTIGESDESEVDEVAPPGWEDTVKALKKNPEVKNPWAVAWSMKDKGYHHHKKK